MHAASGSANSSQAPCAVCPQVNPVNSWITLEDLVRSGVGHTVVSMLIDVQGFYVYDNREALLHTPAADGQEYDGQEYDGDGLLGEVLGGEDASR